MNKEDFQEVVRSGYNSMAEQYHRSRVAKEDVNIAWLDGLRSLLPSSGKVVDLGCGSGVPVSRYFANRGYTVEGFDLSSSMIDLAKIEVPDAHFSVRPIEDLEIEPGSVDLVVSFFAIIHLPRDQHPELFSRIYRWLRPGGAVLLSLGAGDNPEETRDDWYGNRMKWSHYDAERNLRLLADAGLSRVWSEVEHMPKESHLFVIASKSD